MSSFLTEISAAFRQVRRSPGFSALAIAMLAVGIGANVAIFSIFQSIVLNPLPFAAPDRLVGLNAVNSAKALTMPAISPSDFRDLHDRAQSYTLLGAYRPAFTAYVPPAGDPVQLIAANVTEEFFPVLGVVPVAGRVFTNDEFSAGGPRSAIISYRAWRRHFGERAGVLGETIMLNDVPTTVIG